ncbi:MAG: NAD-dependent epimerase/dehydratase family protein [Deltaproteobacteria bacterium]|nr:NAD-dependent epimerase/dehydratase family protein [Deltaproteobacteria bacterium]
MSVAIVGGSGLVGTALVERLLARGERFVVVDRAPPRRAVHHARVDLLDVDVDDLAALLHKHQVKRLVHLVARVDPPRDAADRERMRCLHEEGTRVVVDAARAAGVSRFVLVSSAVVYGAWPHNPLPLTEDDDVAPCPFPYAQDKAAQERVVVDAWGSAAGLTIVRPAIVYGPNAKSYLTELLRRARLPVLGGVLPALDGKRPPLQFVHVDDVAAVVDAALHRDRDGIFHACACDWLAFEEVAKITGARVVDVDARWLGRLLDALVPWMPPALRAPSTLFPYLMHPFVLSGAKTERELGVVTSSSSSALRSILLR